ncbi:hypothetical protein [Paludisphaera borealis]|uniref:Uncharacterized protein n=1 Tax=Paludisphaera borealis TaxID=1387353 RepID=A0A1U7CJW9_9BACT|nr:hypothetical protein [Paludisphaera borealis]APW59207.1 hypothetical protein BSF38_00622 [Paludisphaera borealis]
MTTDNPPDDDQITDETENADDDFVQYEAFEAQNRLWIKAIVPVLQVRMHDAQHNGRLQYALDRLQIAACERLTRILSSDLPPVDA